MIQNHFFPTICIGSKKRARPRDEVHQNPPGALKFKVDPDLRPRAL